VQEGKNLKILDFLNFFNFNFFLILNFLLYQ
jgi:hypothetical protein